ncbi:hypothetical protein JX266_014469, partial [Neoarthrinium moseri]
MTFSVQSTLETQQHSVDYSDTLYDKPQHESENGDRRGIAPSSSNQGVIISKELEEGQKDPCTSLLKCATGRDELNEIMSAPLFSNHVLEHATKLSRESANRPLPQYALLAGDVESMQDDASSQDPRIFYNVAVPSSMFICGSQGSGKSHSLSCVLESCLITSTQLGRLPHPLTGIVFHFNPYISDAGGSPCEAAYLSSDARVKV